MIMYTTADKRSPVFDYDYEIFYYDALTDFTENCSETRAIIVLYNSVETKSNDKLQAQKQNAKLWLNFGCHFPYMGGGPRLF